MTLQPPSEHPHGLADRDFDALFTNDKPIIFAFHGYPWLIHRLTYRRHGHDNLHVRGYKEEGTTTTPFDMCVLNDLDRFHLVNDVIDRVPGLAARAAYVKQAIRDKLIEHREYIRAPRRRHAGDQALGVGARPRARRARRRPKPTTSDARDCGGARRTRRARPPRLEDEGDEHLRRLHVRGVGRAERCERVLLFRFGGQVDGDDDDREDDDRRRR